jgi:hypothetical protein
MIGPDVTLRGQGWLWIDLYPNPVKLNADTSREAIRTYPDDVAYRGAEVVACDCQRAQRPGQQSGLQI